MLSTFSARMKLSEWYGRALWPIHRRFLDLRRRCARCALSEACSPLDAEGVCALCRTAPSGGPLSPLTPDAQQKLEGELDALLREHQGKARGPYDALVLFSGGKDSAFLVHELKRRYPGLRLLAFLLDNGFMSPVALANAAQAADRLDVDYLPFRPAKSLYTRYFRAACLHTDGPARGCFETVDMTELYFFYSIAKNWAATSGIPLILDGLAWAQFERLHGFVSYEAPPDDELRKVEALLGGFLARTRVPGDERYLWRPEQVAPSAVPRLVHPFCLWRFEEQEVRRRVVEAGLIAPGQDSPLLTNQRILVMMVIVDYVRLGYGSYEPDITAQIRGGTADRRYWQAIFEMSEHIAKTGWMMKKELVTIARSLDLTTRELGLAW